MKNLWRGRCCFIQGCKDLDERCICKSTNLCTVLNSFLVDPYVPTLYTTQKHGYVVSACYLSSFVNVASNAKVFITEAVLFVTYFENVKKLVNYVSERKLFLAVLFTFIVYLYLVVILHYHL